MTTSDTTTPPSVKGFYDGLYHSPVYAAHHKVCCNVGFHSDAKGNEENDDESGNVPSTTAPQASKFQAAHSNDAHQLQLYRSLVEIISKHELRLDQQQQKLQILDVGCGAGGGLCELQSLFPSADIIGADISSQAIARARETWTRFVAQNPDVNRKRELRLVHQSCEKLRGVASHSIDIACAVQTLQEVQHLPNATAELRRVLKPGGYLFIADFIPQDTATDRLYNEFLAPLSASNGAAFEIVQETLASYNAALGCQESSPAMKELIAAHFPQEFQEEMETFFFVEGSKLYELLRRDQMGYRLVCLRKNDFGKHGDAWSITGFEKISAEDDEEDFEDDDEDADDWSDNADDGLDEDEDDEEEIFDEDLPNYYDYKELYPQLEVLRDNFDVIVEEMKAVHQSSTWPFWPEKHYAEGDNEWRVFPFCYTFPAFDASKTAWVPPTCAMCPRTVDILKGIPGIRTALFSKLGPGTTLTAHRGWADLSNHILRCHLGLVVPTFEGGEPSCSMVVGGQKAAHGEREVLVFDDSKLHFAYNRHDEQTRVVLIVDLYRPDHLPRGRAKGGHSDELDEFIDTFGKQAVADFDAQAAAAANEEAS
ncbi:Aspartate beta-hydroxylase domain-containing protein 2 [Globisporangium polare]